MDGGQSRHREHRDNPPDARGPPQREGRDARLIASRFGRNGPSTLRCGRIPSSETTHVSITHVSTLSMGCARACAFIALVSLYNQSHEPIIGRDRRWSQRDRRGVWRVTDSKSLAAGGRRKLGVDGAGTRGREGGGTTMTRGRPIQPNSAAPTAPHHGRADGEQTHHDRTQPRSPPGLSGC